MASTVSSARPESTGRSTSAVSGGIAANVRAVVAICREPTKPGGVRGAPVPWRHVGSGNPYRVNPRGATTGVFFVNAARIGLWIAQIPFVQERFDLSKSTLGAVLLTM